MRKFKVYNIIYSYKIRFPEKNILIKDNISNNIKKNNLLDVYTLLYVLNKISGKSKI